MIKNVTIFIFLIISCVSLSCKKEINYSKDNLEFSNDTILFDTVFTTIGSTTKRFKVYNNSNKTLKVDQIQLMGGSNSPFRINIDGEAGIIFSDIEIPKRDSIFGFVEVTLGVNSSSNPLVISDSIKFTTNSKDQYLLLDVWGQDAYFHVNEIVGDAIQPWLNDKPHVIYGLAAVGYPGIDSNLTLTIPAGTKVYGHKDATLLVYKSELNINGTLGNEVVFEGDRLESFYEDVSGQWRGIYLSQAKNCDIDYAIIKNGSVGIQVDTTSSTSTLNINNTIVDNNAFYNLWANAGAVINSENCVYGDAGVISTFLFAGGEFNFNNCNFVNYWNGTRGGPALALKNWYKDGQIVYERDITLNVSNSVIYGNSADELVIDSVANTSFNFDVNFNSCAIKRDEIYNYAYIIDPIWNQDPAFVDQINSDFHLLENSPLIDAANSSSATTGAIDGVSRDAQPDIGAYEF
jgi:hypothetical protein